MFLIRADGNEKIGAGHLMRCMTVAEELVKMPGGNEVCFVCADADSGNMAADAGFRTFVLDTDYRNMESELPLWERFLGDCGGWPDSAGNVILVDSYYVTERYLEELKRFGSRALMDDMGDRAYPVDCIVNYNVFADPEKYRSLYRGTGVKMLIGSRYVPVRSQFRDTMYEVREKACNVLITVGGGDTDHIGQRILRRLYREDRELYFVAGRYYPDLDEVKKLEREHANIHVLHDVKNMAGLMLKCDAAVTAGGSTVYEMAAVGIPFVCFSCAENQEALVEYIGATDTAYAAGAWHLDREGTLERIEELTRRLLTERKMRMLYHRREKGLIDGIGAGRLAEKLAYRRVTADED